MEEEDEEVVAAAGPGVAAAGLVAGDGQEPDVSRCQGREEPQGLCLDRAAVRAIRAAERPSTTRSISQQTN